MYLTQGLHRAVRQTPGLPATVCGDRVRTHRESADRVARLAGALCALGVTEGDRVGILALNSDRYHESLLAVWWLGGVVVPVNTRWTEAEIAHALRESGTTVLLADDAFAAAVPGLREGCPDLARVVHCGDLGADGDAAHGMLGYERLIEGADPVPDLRRGGDALAGIFYTGGTTGSPRGVMLSHTSLLTSALGSLALGALAAPGGRLLHAAPMFHLADLAAWTAQNLVGGTHVMIPAFEPVAVLEALERHRITSALLVPVMIQLLVDHPRADAYDLTSVTSVTYGASPIPETLLTRALKAFPAAGFTQAYGMTEASPVVTLLTPADHAAGGDVLRSAGRAAPHAELRVVDGEDRDVPTGTVGELLVRGDHVTSGYWNRPEETATALRGGWLHTGDAGYLDEDGYVYLVDRIKDVIVTGGENVYSAEVENAVARHPAVAACAVIGVPDDRWGERVHAVVVPRPDATVTLEEIRAHTRTLIAAYKAPRSCELTDALPVSGAGKVLKRELRARHWAGRDRQIN